VAGAADRHRALALGPEREAPLAGEGLLDRHDLGRQRERLGELDDRARMRRAPLLPLGAPPERLLAARLGRHLPAPHAPPELFVKAGVAQIPADRRGLREERT